MKNTFFKFLARGKLTVLLFHKVPVERNPLTPNEMDLAAFERVLQLVTKVFHVMPLDDAVSALHAGNLPELAACITFDDGYADWMRGVVPMLEQHRLHATFFITTGQFSGLPMWNERILHAVSLAPVSHRWLQVPETGWPELPVSSTADKAAAILQLDRRLKYQEPRARERLLQSLEQWAGVTAAQVPTMTASDLRAIHSKGFGIGSHTVAHPILACCTSDLVLDELVQAREQLESIIKGKVTAFAYPNGVPETDFLSEHIGLVKRAGYTCAVTTHWGAASSTTSVFQIPRFTPWGPSAGKMQLQLARNLMYPPRALHEAEPAVLGKKALMIAFHFPPQAGSSGILRTLNFAKYLPRNGWQPIVLSAHPRAYEECRNDLLKTIPADTRVVRAAALDAAKHLGIRRKYPGWIALPDRWSSWWPGAVLAGMRIIREQKPAVIWSTYPITTAHLIGASLAKRSGLPWIADFRDPMINGDHPSDLLQRKVWQWLEARVMHTATRCVFTTERAAQVYRSRYPAAAGKCIVIENGFDEDAFVGNVPQRGGADDDSLLLLHSGIIYPRHRDPSSFFQAVCFLLEQGVLDRSRLCIRFRAPHHAVEVIALAQRFGVMDVVDVAPPIPYRQAIAEMMAADLLLVFQGNHFNSQIPAKIYEYLRTGRSILGLVDKSGDTATTLRQFESVGLAAIDDPQDIAGALSNWLSQRNENDHLERLQIDMQAVHHYSRAAHTQRLADLMHTLN